MILSTTTSRRSSILYVPSPSCRRISRTLSTRISVGSSSMRIAESDLMSLAQHNRVIVCSCQVIENLETRNRLPAGRPCPRSTDETRDWVPKGDLVRLGILSRCSDRLISIRSCAFGLMPQCRLRHCMRNHAPGRRPHEIPGSTAECFAPRGGTEGLVGNAEPSNRDSRQTLRIRNAFLDSHCPVQSSRIHAYQMNTAPSSVSLSNSTIAAPHSGQSRSASIWRPSPVRLPALDNSMSYHPFLRLPHGISESLVAAPNTRRSWINTTEAYATDLAGAVGKLPKDGTPNP